MINEHGDVRFHKIFELMLPMFDGKSFYECLSARMRNYMAHSIISKGWTSYYYCPADEKVVVADDIACFFGCQIAQSLRGNPSINRTWSTREPLDVIGRCMESMPKNAFRNICHCLHFNNDWDKDNKWGKVYADKKRCSPENMAHHCQMFSVFEDGFNLWWKECLIFGRWFTFDESCATGWYHIPIMQGPDPKPICTGATIHSLAITHSNLVLYKVHICVFGGATDGDLSKPNENTITTQKWVNLLLLMLNDFNNNGHCVTMDSAYMGNIMATIGRDMWRINMVGTAQANRTSANIDCTKSMKKGTYNSVCWQHVW
jgi:hypothetical protein